MAGALSVARAGAKELQGAARGRSVALPVLLWLAGAVISGFTLRRNIGRSTRAS